jgi:hypothetical protein
MGRKGPVFQSASNEVCGPVFALGGVDNNVTQLRGLAREDFAWSEN